jgi:hypothetical protein
VAAGTGLSFGTEYDVTVSFWHATNTKPTTAMETDARQWPREEATKVCCIENNYR